MPLYRVTTPEGKTTIVKAVGCDQASAPFCTRVWYLDRKNNRLGAKVTRYYDRNNKTRIYTVEKITSAEVKDHSLIPAYVVPKQQDGFKLNVQVVVSDY